MFRPVNSDDSCGVVGAEEHHSGGCWCITGLVANWVIPRQSNRRPQGVDYYVRAVPLGEERPICGSPPRGLSRHLFFRSPGAMWEHDSTCWCQLAELASNGDVQVLGQGRIPLLEIVSLACEYRLDVLRDDAVPIGGAAAEISRLLAFDLGRLTVAIPLYKCHCGWLGFNPEATAHSRGQHHEGRWNNTSDPNVARMWVHDAVDALRRDGGATDREIDAAVANRSAGYHLMRPATAGDERYVAGATTETHSGHCWCQLREPRDWPLPRDTYYIRKVVAGEMAGIAGKPFAPNARHVFVNSDDELLHDGHCWCALGFADRVPVGDLFGPESMHYVGTQAEADHENLERELFRDDDVDEDNYDEEGEDDGELPPVRPDPVRAMRDRPQRPGGMRHLFRPDGEHLRHISGCWCQATEGSTRQWRVFDQGNREVIFDVYEDELSGFTGRPIDAHAQREMHFYKFDENGVTGEHFGVCWCRLDVPTGGLSVNLVRNRDAVFKITARIGYGELGVQGERFCFACGWQAKDHNLRRTKKGFQLRCPKEKNPDMKFLNLERPGPAPGDVID